MLAGSSLLLNACDYIDYTPYKSKTSNHLINIKNLNSILSSESSGSDSPFRVVFISDIHYSYDETHDLIKYINQLNDISFVVNVGDLTNRGLNYEYQNTYSILKKCRYPVLSVPGNHDFLSFGSEIYRDMFGPLNYSFCYRGFNFILFNSNEESSVDFNWLQSATSSEDSNILVTHISPLRDSDIRFKGGLREIYLDIVSNSVDLAIHGHSHSRHSCEEIDSTPSATIGCAKNHDYIIATFYPGLRPDASGLEFS